MTSLLDFELLLKPLTYSISACFLDLCLSWTMTSCWSVYTQEIRSAVFQRQTIGPHFLQTDIRNTVMAMVRGQRGLTRHRAGHTHSVGIYIAMYCFLLFSIYGGKRPVTACRPLASSCLPSPVQVNWDLCFFLSFEHNISFLSFFLSFI